MNCKNAVGQWRHQVVAAVRARRYGSRDALAAAATHRLQCKAERVEILVEIAYRDPGFNVIDRWRRSTGQCLLHGLDWSPQCSRINHVVGCHCTIGKRVRATERMN